MREHVDVDEPLKRRLRRLCRGLQEVSEERAWVGTRWTVRKRTFVHAVRVDEGWPPAYQRLLAHIESFVVVTVRAAPEDREALRIAGLPYVVPVWFPDIAGVVIGIDTDWAELGELVTDSYRRVAPRRLAKSMG